MRHIICLILLFCSFKGFGQDTTRELNTVEAYQLALSSFLKEHMDLTYNISTPPGKIVFLKQKPFTNGFPESLNGVKIKFVEPSTEIDTVLSYIQKKQQLNILDMQQMLMRETQGYVWIMPMKAFLNPKKRTLGDLKYKGTDCQYIFDYSLGNSSHLLYKETVCKEL